MGRPALAVAIAMVAAAMLSACAASPSYFPSKTTWVGIGSPISEWESTYGAAPPSLCDNALDECFGPIVASHEGLDVFRFQGIISEADVVSYFAMTFSGRTSQRAAMQEVMTTMPRGSRIGGVHVIHEPQGACAIFDVGGATLAKQVRTWLGPASVEVELVTPGAPASGVYDPSDIASAIVQPAWSRKLPNCVAAALPGGVTSGNGWSA
jgi:hypothetical protein